MDKEAAEKIASLEKRIAKLENFIEADSKKLHQRCTDMEDAFGRYLENHGMEHSYLSKMIYPSYGVTHPGAVADMVTFEKILGKTKDDGTDPQP